MRDLNSNLDFNVVLGPVVATADANGTAVDLQDYGSCEFAIAVGIGGITFDATNKIEFVMEESDNNSDFTAVAARDVLGAPAAVVSGIVRALIAAHAAAAVYNVGYRGSKRYARVKTDFSGTHGVGTPVAITAVRGHPRIAPTSYLP